MKKSPFLLAALLFGCHGCPNGVNNEAVKLTVSTQGFRKGCIVLTAIDAQHSANQSTSATLTLNPNPSDGVACGATSAAGCSATVAVYRQKGWSSSIQVKAEAHEQSCTGPKVATGTTDPITLTAGQIVSSGPLTLSAPDVDDDGYIATSAGGTDCDDGDPNVYPGKPCGGSNACVNAGTCLLNGTCSGNTQAVCSNPPGNPACYTGACLGDAGCQYAVDAGASCSSGNLCVIGETCSPSGACGSGSPKCTPSGPCQVATCDGDAGTCGISYLDAGQACAGGTCDPNALCRPSFPYTPTNFSPSAINYLGSDVHLNCQAAFDSTTDAGGFLSWCGQPQPALTVVPQSGGPDLVVLSMNNFSVDPGGSLTLSGARPVIFAVSGNAVINGQVYAGAFSTDGGVGASPAYCGSGTGVNGTNGSTTNPNTAGGGGGGGFGSAGGTGGNGGNYNGNPCRNGSQGGGGGAGAVVTSTMSPLIGGCGGGNGGGVDTSLAGGLGGGGGGAVQFSAAGTLTVDAGIASSGGGGLLGPSASPAAAGGGGGSGGAIFLEGNQVVVTANGLLLTNGGGGGGGGNNSGTATSGSAGPTTGSTQASGGAGATGGGNSGGKGAAGNAAAQNGSSNGGANCSGGGGGGGGWGQLRIRGATGCNVAYANSRFSPNITLNGSTGCYP